MLLISEFRQQILQQTPLLNIGNKESCIVDPSKFSNAFIFISE
jgi:hypothetical protein